MPNPYHDPDNGQFTTKSGAGSGAGAKEAAAAALRRWREQGKPKSSPGLNITESAPPKGKPVILVYGGAFNPPHEGHVNDALGAAQVALARGGYTVDRAIVVPTADKLLASKQMDEQYRLDLPARGRLTRVAFPHQMNGVPVDVSIEPSQIVEKAEGKPRRTDLARWAQDKYPNHTIINVTGEDAVVPGAPAQHPSVYSGEAGSSHEGYYYLTLPRDEGSLSSSAIRGAVADGREIPGMTVASQRAYRAELAKRRKTNSSPKPVKPLNPVQKQEQLAAKHGMTVSEYKKHLSQAAAARTRETTKANGGVNYGKRKPFNPGLSGR